MSGSRENILGAIRRSLKRGPLEGERAAVPAARLAKPMPNLIPARGRLAPRERIELFVKMATEAQASIVRIGSVRDLAKAVADYLASQNLPARIAVAPDPALDATDWKSTALELRRGAAKPDDLASLVPAFAGVAETGSLMLLSGPDAPTSLNFLPDTHIVLVDAKRIDAAYEDVWARIRAEKKGMPRTVNIITGPSRTGDIEQTILMGAHGPRRLHIILVDDGA